MKKFLYRLFDRIIGVSPFSPPSPRHLFITMNGLLNHFSIAFRKGGGKESRVLWDVAIPKGIFYFCDTSRGSAFTEEHWTRVIQEEWFRWSPALGLQVYRRLLRELERAEAEGRIVWRPQGTPGSWDQLLSFLQRHGYSWQRPPREDFAAYAVGAWIAQEKIPLVVHWSRDQRDRTGVPGSKAY